MYPSIRRHVRLHALEVMSNTCIRSYVSHHVIEVMSVTML